MNTIVKNILDFYNRYKTEKKIINCTLFMSRSFGLENRVDIDYDNLKFETKNGNQVRIFINKSDELIVFEILEDEHKFIQAFALPFSEPIFELPRASARGKRITGFGFSHEF